MFLRRKRQLKNGAGSVISVTSKPDEFGHDLWFYDTVKVAAAFSKGDLSGPLAAASGNHSEDDEICFLSARDTVTQEFWMRLVYFGFGEISAVDSLPGAKQFTAGKPWLGAIAIFLTVCQRGVATDDQLKAIAVLLRKNRDALMALDFESLVKLRFLLQDRTEPFKPAAGAAAQTVALLAAMQGVEKTGSDEWTVTPIGRLLLPFLFDHILYSQKTMGKGRLH